MSVTFTCMDAPREKVPCPFCKEGREQGWIEADENCDQWCDGTVEQSVAPEANFANANARAVLDLLGFDGDEPWGECDGATMRQRLFRARNSDRSSALREGEFLPGGHAGVRVVNEGNVARVERMGCAAVVMPNTDADTLRRLDALEALAVFAQEHHFTISWG